MTVEKFMETFDFLIADQVVLIDKNCKEMNCDIEDFLEAEIIEHHRDGGYLEIRLDV